MPMTRVLSPATSFLPDRGIDRVLRGTGDAQVTVDAGHDVSPASSLPQSQLDRLYALRSLDEYLFEELAPQINEPSLLLSSRFNSAIRTAEAAFRAAAQADPPNAREHERAARQLAQQSELRELVRMFQSALLKG